MFKVFNAGPLLAVLHPTIFFPTCFKISILFKSRLHQVRTKNQNMFFQKPNLPYWIIGRKPKNNHDTSTQRKNITAASRLKISLPTPQPSQFLLKELVCRKNLRFTYFKIFGTSKITKENTARG